MIEYVYVERDENKNIKGVYASPQPGYATEEIARDNPEVVAFLAPLVQPKLTTTEKITAMLDANGLTLADLKSELNK